MASASDTRLPVNVSIICFSQAWQSRKKGQDEDKDLLSVQRGWSRIAAGLWQVRIELHWQSPVKTKDSRGSGCCKPASVGKSSLHTWFPTLCKYLISPVIAKKPTLTPPLLSRLEKTRCEWTGLAGGILEVSCLAFSRATGNKIPISAHVVISGRSGVNFLLL